MPDVPEVQLDVVALVGVLFLASAFVWSWLAAKWTAGQDPLPVEPREPIAWRPGVLLITFGWMGLNLLLQFAGAIQRALAAETEEPAKRELTAGNVGSIIAISLVILSVILVALRRQSPQRRLADYGITGERLGRQALIGVAGALASFLPVMSVNLLLLPFRTPDSQNALLRVLQSAPEESRTLIVTVVAAAAVITAPLLEELMFRVVLQGWLVTRVPQREAIALTAFAFAAVHGLPDAIPLLPLAVILGIVYQRTHRYFAVVVLHAVFNAINLALALLGKGSP